MTPDGTTGPYPRLTPAPSVRGMKDERRKADHYDKYRDGCGLCHQRRGLMSELIVVGVGLRALHDDCAETMRNMGYGITPERRKGAR